MELSLLLFLQGFFSLILVVITAILGIKILLRYFKHKQWHLICVGLAVTWLVVGMEIVSNLF